MLTQYIGFIGTGQMARALARGFIAKELVPADHIWGYDPEPTALRQFELDIPGARRASDNGEVLRRSDIVVLAVKPQSFSAVADSLAGEKVDQQLFLSILAGVPLAALCSGLRSQRVARVMPNTPCLVGKGASGYAVAEGAAGDARLIEQLLAAVGIAFALPEKQLDAVTGLSGSGPAYVYLMIEALSDGGVRMGLPRNVATALAAQTVMGAAAMVLETGEHPAVLKDRVTSPAGTTIAGLQILERQGLRSALLDAVEAASRRSEELGKPR